MTTKRAEQILWDFPDPILVLKNNFQVEYGNVAFERMLSISLKAILEKRIHEIGSEIGDGWTNLIMKLETFLNQDPVELKIEDFSIHRNRNPINDPLVPKTPVAHFQNINSITLRGKVYFYEFFNVMGVLDSKNNDRLIAIRFRDITIDVEITDQMVQTEKMSGLGTLAAGLAHELNNPLYSIIGLSEMIISESGHEKINSISQRIIDNSKKMVSVIENLTVYSKSNVVKDREVVNLNERLDAALELALLSNYSKTITIDKDYCSMAFLRARPEEIEQIFFNIISNSIQAMRGKGDLRISSYRVDDEKTVVKIQDTGAGVPQEFIARVFDPFFTTKEQGQGTGLGLTVAYQLIKKYEGAINFNSVQGEGTTVEICWPVKKEAGF